MLSPSFDRQGGMRLALDLLKDFAALERMRVDMEAADAGARAAFENRGTSIGLFALPSIHDLHARCDAFAQKAGHVVGLLDDMAKLFMKQMTDDLLSVSEILMANFCTVAAQPVGGMVVQVIDLPLDQRSNKLQRFYYGTVFGDQIVRVG